MFYWSLEAGERYNWHTVNVQSMFELNWTREFNTENKDRWNDMKIW